ncbi:MAG TPA: N-acetylmuramoyl-L-alanine amidase [Candidatus Kapabacteria bacterium]|nr:N-acetylmuramoyl-L-alanine amidase [Candidatus Kapabacteria bacterium]
MKTILVAIILALVCGGFAPMPPAVKSEAIADRFSTAKHAKLDVIVLDAGHGGRDAGAIGTHGYMEKQATLAIILKLGKLIESQMPGVKVVYTRKSDTFIELYRRGEIANQQKGKLFISVHCNSTPQKPSAATGFTTYILRPGKTDAAIRVAAKENAVIHYEQKRERYYYLSDVDFILTSMSRNQDVKFSEKFASLVQQQLDKKLKIKNNGVSQAGFYVLVGASMPNVLIETGFISNPKEEALLKSESGQTEYAKGILEAIQKYKVIYERS